VCSRLVFLAEGSRPWMPKTEENTPRTGEARGNRRTMRSGRKAPVGSKALGSGEPGPRSVEALSQVLDEFAVEPMVSPQRHLAG